MLPEEIEHLIGQGENQTLEYKTSVVPPQIIARTIAAFANTNGGVIILGVNNFQEVVGLAEDAPASEIVEAAISRIVPQPNVRHYPIELNQDNIVKRLYVIEVDKHPGIVLTENSSAYIRKGSVNIKKEVYRLRSQRDTPQNKPTYVIRLDNYSRLIFTENSRVYTSRESSDIREEILETVPIPQHLKNNLITQLSVKISAECSNSTDSKIRLLTQYLDLLKLTNDLIDVICPADPQKPTDVPYGRTVTRLVFSSVVDSFETYLVGLLTEIHLAKPETLKSDATLTTKEILNCQDLSQVVELAARKRIEQITRGNEKEFTKAFQPAGIKPLLENEFPTAKEFFQIRHLFTHKNGTVDRKFLAKMTAANLNPGDEYTVSLDSLCRAMDFFVNVARRIDSEAVTKHGLSTN